MTELSSIEFDCRVVTPMFLGGADPNEKPEIRAQSIKGLLRWHWRALQDPNMPLEDLKRKEGELFGVAADKVGKSRRSTVSILVTKQPEVRHLNIKDVDGRKLQGPQNLEGNRGYLLYFTYAGDNNKAYWDTNATFTIRFTASPEYVEDLKLYADLFCFMSIFGGFGSRNSRVMGGFEIRDLMVNSCGWEEDKLDWLVEDFVDKMIPKPTHLAPTSHENHLMSSILECDTGEKSLFKALDKIGFVLKQVRKQHKELRDAGLFGLPVKASRNFGSPKQRVNRQTSPLRIRMYQDDGRYYAIYQLHWLSDFSSDEYRSVFNTIIKTVNNTMSSEDRDNKVILFRRSL